jgi:hypothetical protein
MSDPYPSDSSPKGEAGSAAMSRDGNVEWSMVGVHSMRLQSQLPLILIIHNSSCNN